MRELERLKFRGFRWEDFPVVLEFERELAMISFPDSPILDENYHRQKIEKATGNKSDSLVVAELDRDIVGWLWLRTEKDRTSGERFGYVKSIYVKKEYRKSGIGRRLIRVAEERFLRKGLARMNLIVNPSNREAVLFFREMGFEESSLTMRRKLAAGDA